MNKLLPLSIFLFTIVIASAQEVERTEVQTDPAVLEYIKSEKEKLQEHPNFSDQKFKHISAGQKEIISTGTQVNNPSDIHAKINYLKSLNCCEAKIEELESQLPSSQK